MREITVRQIIRSPSPASSLRGAIGKVSATGVLAVLCVFFCGCSALLNGWLDLTMVGTFDRTATLEIRSSLTLEDTPRGISGAQYPSAEDRVVIVKEYPITAGDSLAVEINELRRRDELYQAQSVVSATGYVNLPVVRRIHAAGLTVPAFEESLRSVLRDQNILLEPEVTVNPIFLQEATYSIFGIGASASNNAPLRAGTFSIRRPDLTLLEAINQVGGLNEFVTEIYIFRDEEEPTKPLVPDSSSGVVPVPQGIGPAENQESAKKDDRRSEQQELLDIVAAEGERNGQPVTSDDAQSLLDAVEPQQPYLWVNDEFVPNPAFEGERRRSTSTGSTPPAFDSATPAVNWSRIAGESNYRVIEIPADALRSGEPDVNVYVRAGDVIRIVSGEIGVYYVMGQVNRVGTFAFNAEPITLKAAIAAAGGLSNLAWPDRCTIYRRIGRREQVIQVNLDRIFAGKDADFMIRRSDIINVGTHPFAPFLRRIRDLSIPNPISNVGYSFTYARNYADIDSFAVKQNPNNRPDLFPSLFP